MHMLVKYITVRGILKFTDVFFNWIYWYFLFLFCVNTVDSIVFTYYENWVKWPQFHYIPIFKFKKSKFLNFFIQYPYYIVNLVVLAAMLLICQFVLLLFFNQKTTKTRSTPQATNQLANQPTKQSTMHTFTLSFIYSHSPTHTHVHAIMWIVILNSGINAILCRLVCCSFACSPFCL